MYDTGRATTADWRRVHSHRDFVTFLDQVLADFRAGGEQEWENGTLDRFLDGLTAYANEARDLPEQPTWRVLADLIHAATGYE